MREVDVEEVRGHEGGEVGRARGGNIGGMIGAKAGKITEGKSKEIEGNVGG